MARVFTSMVAGADVVVFSHDHCPPHVTVRHRPSGWVARICFSFVTDDVVLWDVEPQKNAPRRPDLNLLLDEVQGELEASRRHWWLIHDTACLENRWVEIASLGPLLLPKKRAGASQIASAHYDVTTQELSLHCHDGSAFRLVAGSGDEQ